MAEQDQSAIEEPVVSVEGETGDQAAETTTEEQPYYASLGFEDEASFVEDHKRLTEQVNSFEPGYTPKDDFIQGAIDYYERTGDLTPYLEAKSFNYDEMPDEAIMRKQLREEFSDVDNETFEALYRKKVVDEYNLDPSTYSEQEIAVGKALLKAQASKLRGKYKEEQGKFQVPEKEDPTQQYEEQLGKWRDQVSSFDATQRVMQEKMLKIKHGDDEINFEVEPEGVVDMAVDSQKFFSLFVDEKGNYDMDRYYEVMAYASNPDAFKSTLINHGRSLGKDSVLDDIKNPSGPGGGAPRVTAEEIQNGLLSAFANRTRK